MPAGAAACGDKWRVVLARQPTGMPNSVRWHEGKLYFPSGAGGKLQSMPEAGGPLTVMTDDGVEGLWIEGDRLLFASWGGLLFSIPVAGGTPVLLQDGQAAGAEGAPAFFRAHALDATHYYWNHGRQQAAITADAVYLPVSHPVGVDLRFDWSMVKVSR